MRVSPSDVGRLAGDLLDKGPDASGRLAEQLRRWQMDRAPDSGVSDSPGSFPGRGTPTPPPSGVGSAPRSAPSSPATPAPVSWPRQNSRVGSRGDAGSYAGSQGGSYAGSQAGSQPGSQGSLRPIRSTASGLTVPVGQRVPEEAMDVVMEEEARSASPPPRAAVDAQVAALDNLLSHPLSIVDLDKYEQPPPPQTSGRGIPGPGSAGDVPRPPDSAADLTAMSPMRIFTELAAGHETGLLRLELPGQLRDIFMVEGTPESAGNGRLGEYLVSRGLIRADELRAVNAQLPRFGGRFVEALAGAGLMRQVDAVRLAAEHVRGEVLGIFAHTEGRASFYRGYATRWSRSRWAWTHSRSWGRAC